MRRHLTLVPTAALVALAAVPGLRGQGQVVLVELSYRAPGNGPAPNFSPYGTQVTLAPLAPGVALPTDAVRPAKIGTLKVGPDDRSWIQVMATASADFPKDLVQLFVDRNRNGRFDDEGPALVAKPSQNVKTKAWSSQVSRVEFQVPYGADKTVESYLVNFWSVREDDAGAPDIIRYSVGSWRSGTVTVNGVAAFVAVMDANNDALFTKHDKWSVLAAAAPDAPRAVLSHTEARPTGRFMFLPKDNTELVLEFRSIRPDGRSLEFAVVDKPVTKAADRAPDDMVGEERGRPRASVPFAWSHSFEPTLAQAKAAGRKVFVDFETTWCGPCKTMDEWIWTDSEVAALLNAGYVGVKLDGDVEKALVKRYNVTGYPTMLVLDAAGNELKRVSGYLTSKEMLAFLTGVK